MEEINRRNFRKRLTKHVFSKIEEQLVKLTFEEIIEVIPKILDYFTDEQLNIILAEVEKNRKEKTLKD